MNKLQILKVMSEIRTNAENEEIGLEDFLPLSSYANLGEPSKFLILGGRGSGKTKVFRTLLEKDGFRQMIGDRRILFKPNADNSEFIPGFMEGAGFPAQTVISKSVNEDDASAFWAGSVVILLIDLFRDDSLVQDLAKNYFAEKIYQMFLDKKSLKNPSYWLAYIQDEPESWEGFLDDLNEYIEQKDRWVFLAYDSLDRICEKYVDLFCYIRPLLQFWYGHSKRWSRIKCKIFLRNDLYDSEMLAFPDSSKLGSNVLKLEWSTISLYRLLVKKMANAKDQSVVDYLHRIEGLIGQTPEGNLGYIPTEHETIMKKFVSGMIGEYMGSNSKKGVSYSWAPNHLQDTYGVLSPRSFLKCYSVAAAKMCERPDDVEKLAGDRLISPSMIQGAVQDVSEDRVKELQEEYQWLGKLKKAFSGLTLLMDKDEFVRKIRMDLWDESEHKKLPATSAIGIFETLQKLGIVYVAKDGRVNVPEIYLHGFGMRRKGGIRRPV